MKASLVILLIASLAALSFAQIAGGINEAAPPPVGEENPDDQQLEPDQQEAPLDRGGLQIATTQTVAAPTKKSPSPVSFKFHLSNTAL